MRRISNSFRTLRQPSRNAATSNQPTVQGSSSRSYYQPQPAASQQSHENPSSTCSLSPGVIADELHHIQTSVHEISTRIQHLQGLLEHERPAVAQVTEIKRELKTAHRDLEKFHDKGCRALGDGVETLVKDAIRHAWQSYQSMVKLEEKLRGLQSSAGADANLKEDVRISDRREVPTGVNGEEHVYIPTGTRKVKGEAQYVRQQIQGGAGPDAETYTMTSALPIENRHIVTVAKTGRNTLNILRGIPRVIPRVIARRASSHSTGSLNSQQTNSTQFPQPRDEVKRRIQQEEASLRLTLNEPDTVRRGSCDGFIIVDMIMSGLEDHRFVLTYFHYIKHHEVRALKEWLADAEHVTRTATISRMEKVLHCIQLLQTGCRYETLAVIFSRSPRQIKESCLEVMQGLLHLHSQTVNEAGDQEMYMPLWGIWKKFATTSGRAGLYYGFRWIDLAKVLVTLNLYIGRWRMQGRFATNGPSFIWGKFFVSSGVVERAPKMGTGAREGVRSNEASIDDDDTSTSTMRTNAIARQDSLV